MSGLPVAVVRLEEEGPSSPSPSLTLLHSATLSRVADSHPEATNLTWRGSVANYSAWL